MRKIIIGALGAAAVAAVTLTSAASAGTAQPMPAPFSWRHVPDRVADELHVSDRSIEILTSDTLVIITPDGHRIYRS